MEELNDSELGTQEFWNKRYKREILNFRSHGDVGDIWFGDDIVERILKWVNSFDLKSKSILDVGCGNGMLLIELHKCGFHSLHGIDYSPEAIQLAGEIADKEECNIHYEVVDILQNNENIKSYDIVCDKGTYDAISLTENSEHSRKLYLDNIFKYINDDGNLIVTSCNWTDHELVEQFVNYQKVCTIPTPQFKFGGHVGNVVSIVVFKKKLSV